MFADPFDLAYALERFVIHFFASGMLLLLTTFGMKSLWRYLGWKISTKSQAILFVVVCALPTALIPPLREAFDVAHGQPLLKAYTDYASWFLGAGVSSWLCYRIGNGLVER